MATGRVTAENCRAVESLASIGMLWLSATCFSLADFKMTLLHTIKGPQSRKVLPPAGFSARHGDAARPARKRMSRVAAIKAATCANAMRITAHKMHRRHDSGHAALTAPPLPAERHFGFDYQHGIFKI